MMPMVAIENRSGTENDDDIDQLHGDNSNVRFLVKGSSTGWSELSFHS